MIGLMFFAGLAIWLMLAVWISKRIVGWLGSSKYPTRLTGHQWLGRFMDAAGDVS